MSYDYDTTIIKAIQSLPTEVMRYIGGYVISPAYTEALQRYKKIKAVGKKIRNRTDAEWVAKSLIKGVVKTQYKTYKKDINDALFSAPITVDDYDDEYFGVITV